MTANNNDSNLELLNQQIWELRRSVESATALIGGNLCATFWAMFGNR
jgi:hypothetical protein